MLTLFVYLFKLVFVLCGVFYVETTHDCVCPFYRVLLILDFLAPTLVFDDDSLVDSFTTSWMSWFWFSLKGVGAYLLLGFFRCPSLQWDCLILLLYVMVVVCLAWLIPVVRSVLSLFTVYCSLCSLIISSLLWYRVLWSPPFLSWTPLCSHSLGLLSRPWSILGGLSSCRILGPSSL